MRGICHSIIGRHPEILESRRTGPSHHTASTFLSRQFNVLSRTPSHYFSQEWKTADPAINNWMWAQSQYCTWCCNHGRFRRKEEVACPLKNGCLIEKSWPSNKKPSRRKLWLSVQLPGAGGTKERVPGRCLLDHIRCRLFVRLSTLSPLRSSSSVESFLN